MFQKGSSNGQSDLPTPRDEEATSGIEVQNPGGRTHSPFEAASELSGTVIGTDLTILGDKITIISQKSLRIDGDIRGDVAGKDVTIGPEGSVVGTISSEIVDIHGGVRGAVRASSVMLQPTAQVNGEIIHRTLVISEGAEFEGQVNRPKDEAELIPNLDPNTQRASQKPVAPAGNKPGAGAPVLGVKTS
ncbi:MAG: bactofilin family protein [Hyphomicrobiaceae bacterium]